MSELLGKDLERQPERRQTGAEITPPRLLALLVEYALPADSREVVLGDLAERLQDATTATASRRYLADALRVVPLVVWSRMRRQVGWRLLALEAVLFGAIFLSGPLYALTTASPSFFLDQHGFARVALPALVATLTLLLADTYRLSMPVTTAVVVTVLVNLGLTTVSPAWGLARPMVVWSAFVAFAAMPAVRCLAAGGRVRRSRIVDVVPTVAEVISADAVALERSMRVKTLFTSALSLALAGAFGWAAYRGPNLLQTVGGSLMVLAMLYYVYQIYAHRARRLPPGIAPEDVLLFYERELERREAFHRGGVLGARILVMVPGYLLYLAGLVAANPPVLIRIALIFVVWFSLLMLAVPLNINISRRYQHRTATLRGGAPPLRP